MQLNNKNHVFTLLHWMRKSLAILFALLFTFVVMAQERFVYLTTDDVRIDSVLPSVGYSIPLPENFRDSVYNVQLVYPEYIDMSPADIKQYKALSGESLSDTPEVELNIVYDRKKPYLKMGVMPLAFVDGRYKWLVSFKLKIEAKKAPRSAMAKRAAKSDTPKGYAKNSVLREGRWAKIRVSETGIHELTNSVIRSAGFSDMSKVRIYGYGGNLQPEDIREDYLFETDDLAEVPQCIINGKHLFYGKGPVSWANQTTTRRIRNPYSNYGYYFITETKDDVLVVDSATFVSSFYHSNEDYHYLYEVDGYAWYHGGRNLYDTETISINNSKTYTVINDTPSTEANFFINVTADVSSSVEVEVNGKIAATLRVNRPGTYDNGAETSTIVRLKDIKPENTIKLTTLSGGPVRLDYFSFAFNKPRENYKLSAQHPAAEYVHNITNQNHHAADFADMVIIIPTSQKLRQQAERIKALHEEHDGMRVNIVPADELYNEFSSGTPDANAYRRYMKMLYDKAETEADTPKYLLLFGDCVWDNRMLTTATKNLNPNDYLLCFESENSFNRIYCYVDDGFFCLLDEGEGKDPLTKDMLDVAVGRFPVSTAADAKVMVDKTISYVKNNTAGDWQNTIMILGDDGDSNRHMKDADSTAIDIDRAYPEYVVKRVLWDSYERAGSSTGYTYPDVTKAIKAQQESGALIIDYAGHGSETQISHERVLNITDFTAFTNKNLPLWITASCDIMPFDSGNETIGEAAVLNTNGGAFAFYGTTRTVYAAQNEPINRAFVSYVLSKTNGKPTTLGEANRLAKNYLITSNKDRTQNKLQYSLLGDPAVALKQPTAKIVIDSINGKKVGDAESTFMKAGSIATVKGHINDNDDFYGTVTLTVRDSEENITCRLNDPSEASSPFVYKDRPKTLYSGAGLVKDGKFEISFAVPMDINYANKPGRINAYAVKNDKSLTAHGYNDDFLVGGTESIGTDSIGPSIFCYLNSQSFINGGDVNPTPYFAANIHDEDGINTSGAGIGHDLMLIIDGDASKTYNLNDYFNYDFGSYTSGTLGFPIPELPVGEHKLQFRAWDIFNNSSTTTLRFNVVSALEPTLSNISTTNNPASTTTTFIVNHDRMGSSIDIIIDVMDASGRLLWQHAGSGIVNSGNYTVTWDLTGDDGKPLQTGVYLYRARIASDGSQYTSKSKKLIIVK